MWLRADTPALVLAPMEGVLDAPARALLTESGAFAWCVSEFVRVGKVAVPARQLAERVPELVRQGTTPAGTPVHVQLLGHDAALLAQTAWNAVQAGAGAIDLNFGCPGPLVTRRGTGAALLQKPRQIREIVRAVRDALPRSVPVSAKIRLGWESPDELDGILEAVAGGNPSWIVVHARTRAQQYRPSAQWEHLARARERSPVPVIANGDLFTVEDVRRCAELSGCRHFMLGRGVVRDPNLPAAAAQELGVPVRPGVPTTPLGAGPAGWLAFAERFAEADRAHGHDAAYTLRRLKQWLVMARAIGLEAPWIARFKRAATPDEALDLLQAAA